MADPVIGFVLGSKSDLGQMERAEAFLEKIGVPYEMRIMSAHRTPAEAHDYAATAHEKGLKVLVGMAGVAAHLAGVLASVARVPVLGVPAAGGALDGLDALLSTVQMPGGVPVATFAIGRSGALNAAIFACRILALGDEELAGKLEDYRTEMGDAVRAADKELNG